MSAPLIEDTDPGREANLIIPRLGAIIAVLTFAAIVAGLWPALRAAIDPIQALRAE